MKKLVISTFLMVLTACGLYAQDVKFGIKGGLSLPSTLVVKSTPFTEGYDMRLASGMGIFTELTVSPRQSIRFGVEYSGLGGKKSGMQALPSHRLITEIGSSAGLGMSGEQQMALGALYMASEQLPYYYSNIENTTKLVYVTIPVVSQFGWDIGEKPLRFYVNVGPYVSFLLTGKQVASGTDKMYADASGTATLWEALPPQAQLMLQSGFPNVENMLNDPVNYGTTNIASEMKSTNFGLKADLGLRYQRNNNFFFLEIGTNYDLFTTQDNADNGTFRYNALTFMVGYSFKLF